MDPHPPPPSPPPLPPQPPTPPGSVDEALRRTKPTELTSLFSSYLDHINHTSHLLSSLLCPSLKATRSLYQPLSDLLDVLPIDSPLTPPESHQFFDICIQFDRSDNTTRIPQSYSDNILEMRRRFSELSQQLHRHLLRLRSTHPSSRFPHHAIRDTADYLCTLFNPNPNVTSTTQRPNRFTKEQLRRSITQNDAAARGSYILNNNLDTIDLLVARLHAVVEDDKLLIRLGLEMGRSDTHAIQEVVRQFRKNLPNFVGLMQDLEDHVCFCLATLNRAKALLLQEIHRPRT